MVEKLISHFEDLSSSMDKKRPSLRTVSKGRVKKLVNEFTEIKRPAGKSRTTTERNVVASHEREKTLPRSRTAETEFAKIKEKVTRRSSLNGHKDECVKNCTNSAEKEEKTDVNSNPKFTFYDNEPDVQKKLDEFVEKLKQRRSKQYDVESKKDEILEINIDEINLPSVNDMFKKPIYNDGESRRTQVNSEEHISILPQDETDQFLDGSDSDDMFGFNDFDEDSEDNYVVEAYNKPGEELIIATLQITRRSVSPVETSHELLLENVSENVINENEVSSFNGSKDETQESFHHYEDYTRYLSVHIEDDDVFENDIQLTSESDIYEEVNDDYVDLNSITPNVRTLEINNNSEEHFKDNYYQNILFIPFSLEGGEANDDQSANIKATLVETSLEGDTKLNNVFDEPIKSDDNYYQNVPNLLAEEPNGSQSASVKPGLNATSLERKAKINYVIEELIKTEELYLSSLRMVVEKYAPYILKHTPPDLIGKTPYLFGNISVIYAEAQKFLKMLQHSGKTADEVAKVFIKSASIFDAYPRYSKNKPTADIYLKEFDVVVKKRQKELGDKLGLASHLLTPIQRLGKYVIMLENIQKELNKQNRPSEYVSEAINIIRNVMRKGNDSIAIDSIKNCTIDLTLQGSFIMRASFNILRPKKFTSMVFLFDQVVVFTQKAAKNMETFIYVDSIQMSDLSIAKFEEKPCIFHLMDYPKLKKANHDAVTYVLEAETPKIKNDWTRAIEDKLWSQLQKAKENQKRLNSDEGKRFSKVSLPGSPIARQNSPRKKTLRSRSTFYDHSSAA